MSVKDGGPAFPVYPRHDIAGRLDVKDALGMSLRDYFAGQAMQGWIASYAGSSAEHPGANEVNANHVASLSYAIADAMLKARDA